MSSYFVSLVFSDVSGHSIQSVSKTTKDTITTPDEVAKGVEVPTPEEGA